MKLIYRTTLADPGRTLSSYVKGSGLTNSEIDGNFKVIDMEMDLKAPLASPVFSGTPTVPTAAPGTNTLQIASTAFVTAAISTGVGNGTLTLNVSGNGLSGSQTFTANQSGAATFTVTSNATALATASTIMFRDSSGNTAVNTLSAADVNASGTVKIGGTTVIDATRTITNLGNPLSLNQGGTGATTANAARAALGSTTVGDALFIAATAAAARTTLGLGTVSTENTVPLSKGGTGIAAGTVADIRTTILARHTSTDSVNDVSTGSTTTMTAGQVYNVPAAATGVTLNLPVSPSNGNWVIVTSAAASGQVTIGRNGANIMSLAENLTIDSSIPVCMLFYYTASGWSFMV